MGEERGERAYRLMDQADMEGARSMLAGMAAAKGSRQWAMRLSLANGK